MLFQSFTTQKIGQFCHEYRRINGLHIQVMLPAPCRHLLAAVMPYGPVPVVLRSSVTWTQRIADWPKPEYLIELSLCWSELICDSRYLATISSMQNIHKINPENIGHIQNCYLNSVFYIYGIKCATAIIRLQKTTGK